MAYCSWCQMDSDTDDTCVWCKRPFAKNYSVYGADTIAMLRDGNEATTDRFAAFIGVFVTALFVGVVIFAATTYGGGSKGGASADPMNRIAESEVSWSGDRGPSPAAPAAVVPTPRPPVAVSVNNAPQTPTPAPSTRANPPTRDVGVVGTPAQFAMRDGESGSETSGVFIESADLGLSKQKDGTYVVSGRIRVSNVSGQRVARMSFMLTADELKVPLRASLDEVGSGATIDVRLTASDLDPALAKAKEVRVLMAGSTEGGSVRDSLLISG